MQRIGRYQLTKKLGQGGMAEVFVAQQEGPSDFKKTVVVKRMLAHLVENKKFVDMFLREARVAARLNHPNVVQIFELGQDAGTYFLAMEFIDGLPLHRLARRMWARGRALPTEVIVRSIADAALGLHHAHTLLDEHGQPAGLVHRDISPDNLMLTKDGVTKVLDFGIAKGREHKNVTKTGELKGKIPFMSPEQIEGKKLDGRSDLWALGVTFYWLLAGKRPFDGATEVLTLKKVLEDEPAPPSAVNASVPPVLDRIVLRLLEKDPAKRTATGLQLHDRLVKMLAAEAASRQAATKLLAEVLALPDPDELDDPDPTIPVVHGPASVPISQSFAPTTVTRDNPVFTKKSGLLLGVTAAAVTGFIAVLALFALTRAPAAPATPVAPVAPVVVVVDAGVSDGFIGDPIIDAGSLGDLDPLADAGPAQGFLPSPVMRSVALRGPASVVWKASGTTKKSGGSLRVKPGTRSVVAFDTKRGSTHSVPIVNDVADFNALPKGTLEVRAVPFATIYLGAEKIGETPPPEPRALPVGDYVVKLVWEKVTKTQRVTIEKGKTAELRVKMNE